jgi:thymidine phosphorylase
MDVPLGRAVGNALEVIECIEVLKGRGPADLIDVSVELTGRMLLLGGAATDRVEAEAKVRAAIASGDGLERFERIIEHQGGDARVIDDYGRLPSAPDRFLVAAPNSGFVTYVDAELVGRASVMLGAGRDTVDAAVDAGVGIMLIATEGDPVKAGDPVFELHFRDRARLPQVVEMLSRALSVGATRPAARRLIVGEVR